MEKKLRFVPVEHPRCGDDLEHPWKYAVPAYRVGPHIWNVGGQDDVCAYLMDTGEGLILLDTGYRASFYLLLDHIWRLGYRPDDIKVILLSHWHWDHVNGCRYLQELADCKVYISKEDEVLHQKWKDNTDELPMVDFEVTDFYDNSRTIDLGRFHIHTRLTPGHTPGTTSFWFDDTDEETGKTYRCAMHGGLGVPMMKPDNLAYWDLTEELAHTFVRDCTEIAEWPVTINLPSHLNMGNVKANIPEDKNDYSVWIADYVWKDVLLDRAEAVKKYYPDVYPEVK